MICALSRLNYFDNDKNLMDDVFWQQSKRVYFRFEWFIKFIKSNSIINLFFISVKWGNYLFFNTIPVLAVVVSFARHYSYVLFLSKHWQPLLFSLSCLHPFCNTYTTGTCNWISHLQRNIVFSVDTFLNLILSGEKQGS